MPYNGILYGIIQKNNVTCDFSDIWDYLSQSPEMSLIIKLCNKSSHLRSPVYLTVENESTIGREYLHWQSENRVFLSFLIKDIIK